MVIRRVENLRHFYFLLPSFPGWQLLSFISAQNFTPSPPSRKPSLIPSLCHFFYYINSVPFLHSIFLRLYVCVIISLRSCFHYESRVSQCLFLLTNVFTISMVLIATLLRLFHLLTLWCGQLNLSQSYIKGYESAAFRQVPQSHKCRLIYQKQTPYITLTGEILRMFPFTSRTRSGGPQSPRFFNIVLEVSAVHPESERIEYTNIGKKEIKIIIRRWLCMHT